MEPNVKEMGQLSQLPLYLQRGADGCISASNWMVWLFLAMTQPEQEAAVVDWYWWATCHIFIDVETFNRAMGECPLPTLEGICYIPRRLQTPATGFKINDLVEHFVKCGLRPRDAESIFRDFASHYLAHIPQASEPNWSNVSPPPAATSRCTVKERVKLRRKEFKATQM
jgi:hypothetical protein